jgi:isoquinoline 1-oxidoreductase alpha subunit
MINVTINGQMREIAAEPDTPILWVLRDELGLVGTKFGCGLAQCGACTVHLNGKAIRSCSTPIAAAEGQSVTTIEGLAKADGALHPVQKAWVALDVAQCGYCQPGQMMSAAALLNDNKKPSDADIDHAMFGNLCRCGTYNRIRAAIHAAASEIA